MKSNTFSKRLALLPLMIAAACAQAADAPWGTDIAEGKDHSLVRRFDGAWLVGYRQEPWTQVQLPTGPTLAGSDKLAEVRPVEGQVTRLVYLAPKGKSPLEVWRNHEQAFSAAGFKKDFSCESNCDKLYWAWYRHLHPFEGVHWLPGAFIPAGQGGGKFNVTSAIGTSHGMFWSGSALRGGQPTHVVMYASDAVNDKTNISAVFLEIVEPKAMATGQVVVADASTLQTGLKAEGKATLGGLLFDTGKAELKPESKPQLEALAAALKAQPAWKVFIVGHTDNVGALEANLSLSQQRAQAVVTALSAAPYGIDGKRLLAKGVANLVPVATNEDDAGRARNRRVEMVLQ